MAGQVPYLNRWVDRDGFRAFVYNEKQQKLAKSYNEFAAFLATGLWFDSHESVSKFLANKKVNELEPVNEEKPLKVEVKTEVKAIEVEKPKKVKQENSVTVININGNDVKTRREKTKAALKSSNLGL